MKKKPSYFTRRSSVALFSAFGLCVVFAFGTRFAAADNPLANPPSGAVSPTFTSLTTSGDVTVGGTLKSSKPTNTVGITGNLNVDGILSQGTGITIDGTNHSIKSGGNILHLDGKIVDIIGALNAPSIDTLGAVTASQLSVTNGATFNSDTTFNKDINFSGVIKNKGSGIRVQNGIWSLGQILSDGLSIAKFTDGLLERNYGGIYALNDGIGIEGRQKGADPKVPTAGNVHIQGVNFEAYDDKTASAILSGTNINFKFSGGVTVGSKTDLNPATFSVAGKDGTTKLSGNTLVANSTNPFSIANLNGGIELLAFAKNINLVASSKGQTVNIQSPLLNVDDTVEKLPGDIHASGNITATNIGTFFYSYPAAVATAVAGQNGGATTTSCPAKTFMISCGMAPSDPDVSPSFTQSGPFDASGKQVCAGTAYNKGKQDFDYYAQAACFDPLGGTHPSLAPGTNFSALGGLGLGVLMNIQTDYTQCKADLLAEKWTAPSLNNTFIQDSLSADVLASSLNKFQLAEALYSFLEYHSNAGMDPVSLGSFAAHTNFNEAGLMNAAFKDYGVKPADYTIGRKILPMSDDGVFDPCHSVTYGDLADAFAGAFYIDAFSGKSYLNGTPAAIWLNEILPKPHNIKEVMTVGDVVGFLKSFTAKDPAPKTLSYKDYPYSFYNSYWNMYPSASLVDSRYPGSYNTTPWLVRTGNQWFLQNNIPAWKKPSNTLLQNMIPLTSNGTSTSVKGQDKSVKVGQFVIAYNPDSKKYWDAVITKVNKNGTVTAMWVDDMGSRDYTLDQIWLQP